MPSPDEYAPPPETEDTIDVYDSGTVGWAARLIVIVPAGLLYVSVGLVAWFVGPPFRGMLFAHLLGGILLLVLLIRRLR